MRPECSRRHFLSATLGLPMAGAVKPFDPTGLLQTPPAAPELRYGNLGKTGLKPTRVGFGCMLTSDQSVFEAGLDKGINLFDTARSYMAGNTERMVGQALKGKRKQVILTSKSQGETKEALLQDLDTSLKTLGTDYLDIWYLHAKVSPEEVRPEMLEAQQIAKQQGKIRFAGVSTHLNLAEMIRWLVKNARPDVILTSYNFTVDRSVGDAIREAKQAGVGVIGMKVMAGGYSRIQRGDRLLSKDDPKKLEAKLRQEGAMAAAIKWTLQNSDVDAVIPSMTDMDQLDEDFKAMSSPFTPADAKLLAAQLESIRPLYCRMCGKCDGACPSGLPVAAMLRVLSYADGYGQYPLARERFQELGPEAQKVRCSDCARCAVACPNGVQVARQLARAQELLA
jgi:uncharacterized protein